MASSARHDEVIAADMFLAESKRLRGGHPHWTSSARPGEIEARWPIDDRTGVEHARGSGAE